jgi:hypothetical protein
LFVASENESLPGFLPYLSANVVSVLIPLKTFLLELAPVHLRPLDLIIIYSVCAVSRRACKTDAAIRADDIVATKGWGGEVGG